MLLTQRIQESKTTDFRTAGTIRAWVKPKPLRFDGRTDIEGEGWTDLQQIYEIKGLSKLTPQEK